MKVSSILTVLDKPKDRPLAFERSVELQKRCGATLSCFAFTWHPICETADIFEPSERTKMRTELLQSRTREARHTFESVTTSDVDSGKISLKALWCKDIAGWVAKELAKTPRDLVVKTVHQSKTLLHTPLDWELLRTCPSPVLLTAAGNRGRSGVVLATLDLRHSDAKHRRLNMRVLNAARYFADLYSAEVHVVAVTAMSQVLHDLEILDERAFAERAKVATQPHLDTLIAPFDLARRQVHQPVGKVGVTVGRLARKLKADLLVVGSSAHRVRQTLGLGSTAEQILLNAECDVLAVHP